MHCEHFRTGRCGTCTLIELPAAQRLDRHEARLAELLRPALAGRPLSAVLGPRLTGADAGFRNTAKMVVSGTANDPVLGILDDTGLGVDLSDCPLYPPAVHTALSHIPTLIRAAQIPPYRVGQRRGELKHVLLTHGDDDRLLVRFVMRTAGSVARLEEKLPGLLAAVPAIAGVSVNLNSEHTAIIEGAEDIHIWGERSLPVTQGDVTLLAGPGSFLQTNTAAAGALYRTVRQWTADAAQADTGLAVWDLYCGVGGFALHAALSSQRVHVEAVEVSPAAIARARRTAADSPGLERRVRFTAADALSWAEARTDRPDLLIVNPPRRGLGAGFAAWIEHSGIPGVFYSSCNPATLAADLRRMPSLHLDEVRLVDMFPHTEHLEVLVRLVRD